jgi:uncharacterized damage-inducible protein DinB
MTQQDILTLYDFNRWANGRTLEAAAALSAEQFVRDLGSSFPSVRDTLAHILGAEWAWLRRWQGESPTTLLKADEFPTAAALRERFAAVDRERDGFLRTLSPAGVDYPFDYRDLAGKPGRLLLAQSMQHVVNHGTYHRGQVTTLLRQLGAKPVGTDLSRFYLEQQAGR